MSTVYVHEPDSIRYSLQTWAHVQAVAGESQLTAVTSAGGLSVVAMLRQRPDWSSFRRGQPAPAATVDV
jgi:hypothetical protein